VIAAVILFSVGWWAAAIGTLLGLYFFRVTTRRIRGTFRRPDGDSRRPSGLWTVVGIQVTTMAVFIFITLVVGGTVVDVCFSALCTQTLALLTLIVLLTRPQRH